MADRLDSERLRGFDFRLTDRQTDRQTFAIVESLSRLKNFRSLTKTQKIDSPKT